MVTPEQIECIVTSIIGTGTAFTAIGAALKKAGLLHLGKNGKSQKNVPQLIPCGMHEEISTTLQEVKLNQALNTQKHEQHAKDLEAGSKRFETIAKEMSNLKSDLREGIGILMDRTGGRPEIDKWRK